MNATVNWVIHRLQVVIVRLSRWLHLRHKGDAQVSWVIGPVEIAAMVANLARVLPGSYSVNLTAHRFYDFTYDLSVGAGRGDWTFRRFTVPWKFGRLSAKAIGFVYVGAEGYLLNTVDDRAWEFAFLRQHGVRVVCLFTGSDIRSPRLMRQFQDETGLETIATYLDQVSPVFASPEYDAQRRRVAAVADQFANVIFSAAVDQLSYIQRPTESFPYFYPDEHLLLDQTKHHLSGPRVVLHAPSSPIIKGTQVVRAAVLRLKSEGYDFIYRELLGVPHGEVLQSLREAHIVLNEFYAFVPGVFGVEAMANNCALLTRADESIEASLPKGSNSAWLVTSAADVYSNLRMLLDEPELIAPQAAAGLAWVQAHATASASGARLRETLRLS